MSTANASNGRAMTSESARSGRAVTTILGLAAIVLAGAVSAMFLWPRPESSAAMPTSQVPVQPAKIDGTRAFGYLKQICELGPRPAGSEANTRQRQLVAEHFRKLGAAVTEQKFRAPDPLSHRPVEMVNLVGSWHPERTDRVVICAHYDTRPHPDQELDPRLRNAPFIGANDGASGVALMMELAHHLNESPTEWGVDLVLFDGEELVYDRVGEYFLGSKEFARRYKASRRGRSSDRYQAGILLDMVGGKDLALPKEPYSLRFAEGLVRDVWAVAKQVKADAFLDDLGREVLDDHLALNNVGIPTIDLIDFDYMYWHTAGDLPEQCAPESLEQVGRVLSAWLSKPKPKPNGRR